MKKTTLLILSILALAVVSCRLFTLSPVKSDELQISPDTLPEGQVGKPYAAVITISNQRTPAFNMSVPEDALPPGLAGDFDKAKQTYTFSGTPTQPGSYSLTFSALCYGTNSPGQTGEKEYQLVVK